LPAVGFAVLIVELVQSGGEDAGEPVEVLGRLHLILLQRRRQRSYGRTTVTAQWRAPGSHPLITRRLGYALLTLRTPCASDFTKARRFCTRSAFGLPFASSAIFT